MYAPHIEIDLNALHHNLMEVKRYAPKSNILAMIKANGYGHGQVECAQAMPEANAFGVARFDEAQLLRESGIKQPIVLMGGVHSADDLAAVESLHLDMVVHDHTQLTILQQYNGQARFNVWLKLDTGMNRLGFNREDAQSAYESLTALACINKPIKMLTHLIAPERLDKPFTQEQFTLFQSLTRDWVGEKSVAKSAAVICWPDTHLDWVRPGIMLYGISPFSDQTSEHLSLEPVMTFKTQLLRVNHCKAGDNIGYGGECRLPHDADIGIAAVGYADGYPRHIQPNTPVLVNGQRCTVVGRVSMDLLMIDLSPIGTANVGDEVVLWGKGLPVEVIAASAQTIPYTLTTAVTARVKRVIIPRQLSTLGYATL